MECVERLSEANLRVVSLIALRIKQTPRLKESLLRRGDAVF